MTGLLRLLGIEHGGWASWLVPAIYAGCLAAFVADLGSANTLAFGVFYTPLVATAVFSRDKRAVWVLTAIACGMDILGAMFPIVAADLPELLENRALSICAILATAAFVSHARSIQEQLAAQTSRAEAAERIKTEVLTNLTQEIRGPLYSMIGVLELVAAANGAAANDIAASGTAASGTAANGTANDWVADNGAKQKSALAIVRAAGRRLVTMVDNLVDLTQFDGRSLRREAFDLCPLLRQTAEAKRQDAAARQIDLTIDIPAGAGALVSADPWAARRILENKISDAIVYTPPGGRIVVSTATGEDGITAVIDASGSWPAAAFRAANDPAAVLSPSAMGLALSHRLAQAMDARLVFVGGPGGGTTARLILPLASAGNVAGIGLGGATTATL
jgi:signal transduction histidine kinase